MPFRKVSRCHQDLMNLINKIADIFCFDNVTYTITYGCEDIDSFLGGIYKVQVEGSKDGQKIKNTVIMKWHPEPKMRTCFREFYKRENVFYQCIVPKLLMIQKSFRIIEGLKIKFPNCIFSSVEHGKETVAILGLQEDGFRLYDRFHKTNFNQASLVMKNFAKLHALSFVLEKCYPENFEEIKNLCNKDVQYSDLDRVSQYMKVYYDASVSVVRDFTARQRLAELGPHIFSVLQNCTAIVPHYSAICHGDCWNNNIFFKNKGEKSFDIVFVDYQMSRLASPVTDISYYLYMSTDGEFLHQYYDQILEIYYGTLSAVLRQCDLSVNDIYPRKIFKKHLEIYSVFGLIEALVAMKIITALGEEALEMVQHYRHNIFVPSSEASEQSIFTERVNSVVNHFFHRKYCLDHHIV